MTLSMLVGAVDISFRALKIMAKFVSKMKSWSPISLANETTLCIAFASASRGPNDSGMRLLRAVTTEPSWSHTTTPIPTDLEMERTMVSMLICRFLMMRFLQVGKLVALKHASGFKDYLLAGLSYGPMACFISCIPHAPCNGDHQLKQFISYILDEDEMPNEVHKFLVVYGRVSMGSAAIVQVSWAFVQSQNRCPLVSLLSPHASHKASSRIPR